jgi:hypothetical protein
VAHEQPEEWLNAPTANQVGANRSPVARALAGASVGMGFFSACVFWWTPFSGLLAAVGLILGLISLLRGVKGGLRGENYAMVGTLLCATSLAIGLTLNQSLRYLQWDQLPFVW